MLSLCIGSWSCNKCSLMSRLMPDAAISPNGGDGVNGMRGVRVNKVDGTELPGVWDPSLPIGDRVIAYLGERLKNARPRSHRKTDRWHTA